MSEAGERGEGQKSEWRGEVSVVDAVDDVNSVEAELTDWASHELTLYDSLGSLSGSA